MKCLLSKTERFFNDAFSEVQADRAKFPNNAHLLAVLMEEVGELAQAMQQHKYEPDKGITQEMIYKEAVQVGCVAARIATEGDADFLDWLFVCSVPILVEV